MDAREGGVKKDPAAVAAHAGDDGDLSGAHPAGLAGADFNNGQGSSGPTGGGDLILRLLDLPVPAHAGGGRDHAIDAPAAAAGRRDADDPHGLELDQDPLLCDLWRGGAGETIMHRLAILALLLGATVTLTGEPAVPWLDQFAALLAWLAGCVLLFLSLRQ